MSVDIRKNRQGTSFQVTISHKGERYRRQFATQNAALIWEAEAKLALLQGVRPELGEQAVKLDGGRPQTIRELADYTAARYWNGQKAVDKTKLNAEAVVRHFGPTCRIDRIDAYAIDKFVIALGKAGNAPATINRKMSALSKMLNTAVGLDIIPKRPQMERLKETERRSLRFTPDIEKQALAYFERTSNTEMQDYIVLSLDTGLRQGEVLRLRWTDTNSDSLTVYESKGGKNRVVPLTARVRERLDCLCEALYNWEPPPSSLVLSGGITKRQITYHWNRMKEALNLQNEASFVPHLLRHEFCSRLADRGVNASAIQRLAGHSSLMVTQRYVNLSPYALQDAIKTLEPGTGQRTGDTRVAKTMPHTAPNAATSR